MIYSNPIPAAPHPLRPPYAWENRTLAGKQLARAVQERCQTFGADLGTSPAKTSGAGPPGFQTSRPDWLVLALPRGGVPVALEVARALSAPLDVLVVRKLGAPHNPELALGAIASLGPPAPLETPPHLSTQAPPPHPPIPPLPSPASAPLLSPLIEVLPDGVVRVLNPSVLGAEALSAEALEALTQRELRELRRREDRYRGGRPPPRIAGRSVVLVDDGVATGATLLAALQLLRSQQPLRLIAAVPVAPRATLHRLAPWTDQFVVLQTPDSFHSVSQWYDDFGQVQDETVVALLESSREESRAGPPPPLDSSPASILSLE